MTLSIRRLQTTDLPAVADLFDQYRQFYEQPSDFALALRFMTERLERGESVVLVAQAPAGEPLGFCQLYPSFCSVEAAPIYTLYDLFVSPQVRGQGVGRLLLLAAEQQARCDGKARLDLSTAKTNLKAQSLYKALGWVRDELFFSYSRRLAPRLEDR